MRTFKSLLTGATLAAGLLAFGGAASAHGGTKPEHGGVLKVVGETTIELVKAKDHLEVWVEDEGEEVASSGLTGKILVETPAKKEIALQAAGENKLVANGATLSKGSQVTVLITFKSNQAKTAATFKID